METQAQQDGTGIMEYWQGAAGKVKGKVVLFSAPSNSVSGFGIGAMWVNKAGTVGSIVYLNVGTESSTTWVAVV